MMAIAMMCVSGAVSAQDRTISPVDITRQDSINRVIYNRVADKWQPRAAEMPTADLMVAIAKEFLGTDYLWASLEEDTEQLRVYLDRTDCILFVEMTTCFALTLKGKRIVQAGDGEHYALRQDETGTLLPSVETAEPSYELLVDNIRNMRYRLGVVDGYSSRIHYTSEWLLQNQTNGLMREYSSALGSEFEQTFSYMSMHPKTCFQLMNDPCELGRIRMMEERLNEQKPYYFISQAQLRQASVMKQIKSGDIITFISPREGLDLAHVAIAYEVNGEMHFIHASYGKKKVIVEQKTLADYANNGIRITRVANL